eukprot:6807363-Pyramimonas_sp.AAC.2
MEQRGVVGKKDIFNREGWYLDTIHERVEVEQPSRRDETLGELVDLRLGHGGHEHDAPRASLRGPPFLRPPLHVLHVKPVFVQAGDERFEVLLANGLDVFQDR